MFAAWIEAIRTRTPFHAEYRDVKPDGSVVWVRDHSLPVHGDDGEPLFWQGVLDITAERETEALLHRTEARNQDLVERLPVIVYLDAYDAAKESRYVSPNVGDVLGHQAAEFVSDTSLWARLLHPDDAERASAAWERGWSTGTGWSIEYRSSCIPTATTSSSATRPAW